MANGKTSELNSVTAPLLNHLDSRDIVLWVLESAVSETDPASLANLLRLPWRAVLSDSSDVELLKCLDRAEDPNDPLVRRRGFVQVIDVNPAEVALPPRCLPIYLLQGRGPSSGSGLAALTRRLTMLSQLKGLQPRELIILSGRNGEIPSELTELWNDGFRTLVSVVSDSESITSDLDSWRREIDVGSAAILRQSVEEFCKQLFARYLSERSPGQILLRVRDERGNLHSLDVTSLDDPERPILSNYALLQQGDVRPLQPADLTLDDTRSFFKGSGESWKPYAAGMPWQRDEKPWRDLRALLRRLDRDGSDASRIAIINAETGSGGTTLLRTLAWMAANEGYPTLIAGAAPFAPKAIAVSTYITRVLSAEREAQNDEQRRHYEVPWVIAFDGSHWEGREDELAGFLNQLRREGRTVCILAVSGPYLALQFYDRTRVQLIADLSHQLTVDDAISLGRHLNPYLDPHGPTRTESEWRSFYDATTVQSDHDQAAFWIALSFWVERQFNLTETIQAWIFRQFDETVSDPILRKAILFIAGMSSERRPLPQGLLPPSKQFPTSQKLEDLRRSVPALGLARLSREGDSYWAMAHDVIGRYLLTALFYDDGARQAAGYATAQNPEHLRFQVLRELSASPLFGHLENREIADEFAISIFKIDPDHGHATFVPFWREVLGALDEMPKLLQATSRAFRHHTAISRRRIAKQPDVFQIEPDEQQQLLERVITDIRYALENIPKEPGGETDVNLYNSLAHAYQDLAEIELARNAPAARILELRKLAGDATLRAYQANPDNSFTIETYARNLLGDAQIAPERTVENCLEVLNLVFAAMHRDTSGQRRFALGKLADTAIDLLLRSGTGEVLSDQPTTQTEAFVRAIRILSLDVVRSEGMELSDYPLANRQRCEEALADPLLQGNPQAVRFRYALNCLNSPRNFSAQLELLASLNDGGVLFTPQMRLELAVLLHQRDRHHEGEMLFRQLRRLWKEGEHYVEVPSRLRWLMTLDGTAQRQVNARVAGGGEFRRFAKIREMQESEVPFRPQEFGEQAIRPGTPVRGYISFGHNGPFLRPTTALQG